MISPIISMQGSSPVANIQQNTDGQSILNSQNAQAKVQQEKRQIKETVVQKEEAVFYHQRHDAKEEGKNKYENLYSNRKKKKDSSNEKSTDPGYSRINFDVKI